MRLLGSINDVSAFCCASEGVLVSDKNVLRMYNFDSVILWSAEIQGKIVRRTVYEDRVFIEYIDKVTGFEKTTVVDVFTGQVQSSSVEDYMIRSVSSKGLAIALKYRKDYSTSTHCVDLSSLNILWERDFSDLPVYIDDLHLVLNTKRSIASINYDGSTNWESEDLGQASINGDDVSGEVSTILGIYQGCLFVYLTNGRVLQLSMADGSVLSKYENTKNTDQGSFKGMFMNAIQLDAENGKLIQLFNQRYTELDLDSGLVTQTHLDGWKEQGLENMNQFVYDDSRIYFSDRNHGLVGALSRSTLKVDWIYDFASNSGNDQGEPQYARELKLEEGRLYLLDNRKQLKIFENQPA